MTLHSLGGGPDKGSSGHTGTVVQGADDGLQGCGGRVCVLSSWWLSMFPDGGDGPLTGVLEGRRVQGIFVFLGLL